MIKNYLICSDTATKKLVYLDENGKITRELGELKGVFDLWQLPGGQILCAHNNGLEFAGVTKLNQDGTVAMRYLAGKELFSCQPLENGNALLGLLGEPELREIDPQGNIVNSIKIPYEGKKHEGMRIARQIGDHYFLVQPGINRIRKLSLNGEIVKELEIRPDAFGLVVLPSGNIVYTCMSGAYELDEEGNEVWSLTNEDVPGIHICWLLGVQLLSGGNLAFANWMGHGHLDEGVHFFAVNRQKEVVWSLDSRGTLQAPATFQLLDEDTEKVCYTPLK